MSAPQLIPVGIDKDGPRFSMNNLMDVSAHEVAHEESSGFIKRTAQGTATDYDRANKVLEDARAMFIKNSDALRTSADSIANTAKKASQDVRKAADDMASGLLRIEKQANFNNLERYVGLLERAATAMQTLAELEKSGRLEKIAASLK
jgi:hypothetical protein